MGATIMRIPAAGLCASCAEHSVLNMPMLCQELHTSAHWAPSIPLQPGRWLYIPLQDRECATQTLNMVKLNIPKRTSC